MSKSRVFLSLMLVFGIVIITSCKTVPAQQGAKEPSQMSGVLQGHVTYLEKIALPEAFWIEVQLVQLKNDGSPEYILARSITEKTTRTIPAPFMMRYSPKAVSPGTYKYGLIASIYIGKKVWFVNQTPYPIFQGKDDAILVVTQKLP